MRSHGAGTPALILSRIDMEDVFSFSFHRCNLRRICRLFKAIHPVSGGSVAVQNQKQTNKKGSHPLLYKVGREKGEVGNFNKNRRGCVPPKLGINQEHMREWLRFA